MNRAVIVSRFDGKQDSFFRRGEKMSDTVIPKILPNVPVGDDEFASKSQEHIAESIKNLILNIDDEKKQIRLIGIEGGWGTGKSNLVKILEKKLGNQGYSFFLYDAWGHQ